MNDQENNKVAIRATLSTQRTDCVGSLSLSIKPLGKGQTEFTISDGISQELRFEAVVSAASMRRIIHAFGHIVKVCEDVRAAYIILDVTLRIKWLVRSVQIRDISFDEVMGRNWRTVLVNARTGAFID